MKLHVLELFLENDILMCSCIYFFVFYWYRLEYVLILFLIKFRTFRLLIHKFSSSELDFTKPSVCLSYMVFNLVYHVKFQVFGWSFVDVHFRPVCNPKTDSKSEFRGWNTVEERERCTREERCVNMPHPILLV